LLATAEQAFGRADGLGGMEYGAGFAENIKNMLLAGRDQVRPPGKALKFDVLV
jgi:hypothetical protein